MNSRVRMIRNLPGRSRCRIPPAPWCEFPLKASVERVERVTIEQKSCLSGSVVVPHRYSYAVACPNRSSFCLRVEGGTVHVIGMGLTLCRRGPSQTIFSCSEQFVCFSPVMSKDYRRSSFFVVSSCSFYLDFLLLPR